MRFNFDSKINKPRNGDKIFHLPPSNEFVRYFIEGLLSRFQDGALKLNPELLGKVLILTANKSLANQIESRLEDNGFIILPKIIELARIEDIFYEQPIEMVPNFGERNQYKNISNLERFLLLKILIEEVQDTRLKDLTNTTSFDLAYSLDRLIEEFNMNSLSSNDLKKLTDEELPRHLQLNLVLLKHVIKSFEKISINEKIVDKPTKYLHDVKELIGIWQSETYQMPLLLVGSTGSQPATSKLMKAITELPQGFIILPGLDTHLTNRGWNALTPDHPQYGFLSLCKNWGLEGTKRDKIIRAPTWYDSSISVNNSINIRRHLFSLIMRPGPVTDEWRSEGKLIVDKLSDAMKLVTLIEAENSRQEIASISVGIKEKIDKGLTVALITPSKLLARRVTAELQRWSIVPNNSLGISLAATDFGIFFRQGALALEKGFKITNVIGLLQNRHCGGGYQFHDSNISKLQQLSYKSDASFLDLEEDWLVSQDLEFINWCNWLKELFLETNQRPELEFLEETFLIHKSFLQKLMIGYQSTVISLEALNDQSAQFILGEPFKILKILSDQLCFVKKRKRYEFHKYLRIVEKLLDENTHHLDDEHKHPGVFIWGTLESRTRHADVFILAGLNEGIWPSYHQDDFWLNRSMRSLLGIDLLERKIGLSAHDFQQGVMANNLILSRSLRDNNAPSIASRWLVRLENLLVGLGGEGKRCLNDIKSRGLTLTKLAREVDASDLVKKRLSVEVKCPAVRPAPIPPLSARPNKLSVTEVETLIRNPYSVYAKKVLNLKKIEHIRYTEDPRTRGNLLHSVLEKFISANFKKFPKSDRACHLLREHFSLVLKNERIPIKLQSIWMAQFDLRIKEIVRLEKLRRRTGEPVALETFGKYAIELKNNEIFFITAKADRIDKGSNGFTIYDYKTGQVSKRTLERFSPQLDIEAIMLNNRSFKSVSKGSVSALSLIGLGSDPKQYEKLVTKENLVQWRSGLVKIIEQMKLELTPFVALAKPLVNNNFSDNYLHLSRFGEWNDNDEPTETLIETYPLS